MSRHRVHPPTRHAAVARLRVPSISPTKFEQMPWPAATGHGILKTWALHRPSDRHTCATAGENAMSSACNIADDATSLRAIDLLALAAAPTFATMALITGTFASDAAALICSAGSSASPLHGMAAMYALMCIFHLAPWLKRAIGRRAAVNPNNQHAAASTMATLRTERLLRVYDDGDRVKKLSAPTTTSLPVAPDTCHVASFQAAAAGRAGRTC